MDALTYVVLAGWVLMYFVPNFMMAVGLSVLMAMGAGYVVFSTNAGHGAELAQTMLTVAPIAFIAVFVAWPLGVAMRWLRGLLKRAGADG
ncbi:MAG: hypothetical protein AAGM21_11050 [Pseudomonadota bacterium]